MLNSMSNELRGACNANMTLRLDLEESMQVYQKSNKRLIDAIAEELTGSEIDIEYGNVDYGSMTWSPNTTTTASWHSWYNHPRHPRFNDHDSNMLKLSGTTTVLGAVALKVPGHNDERSNGIEVVHLVVDGTTDVIDASLRVEGTFSARQQIATRFDRLVFSLANQSLATSQ